MKASEIEKIIAQNPDAVFCLEGYGSHYVIIDSIVTQKNGIKIVQIKHRVFPRSDGSVEVDNGGNLTSMKYRPLNQIAFKYSDTYAEFCGRHADAVVERVFHEKKMQAARERLDSVRGPLIEALRDRKILGNHGFTTVKGSSLEVTLTMTADQIVALTELLNK